MNEPPDDQKRFPWLQTMAPIGAGLSSIAGPLLGVLIVLAIFGAWRSESFLTADAFETVARNNYHIAIAAVGATFVIITGGIDLSAGSVIAFSMCTCAMALRGVQFPEYDMQQGIAVGGGIGLLAALCAVGRALQAGRSTARAAVLGLIVFTMFALFGWGGWRLLAGRALAPMATGGAVAVGMVSGGVIGLINGLLVTCASLPPFIVTLATMGAVRGLTLYITNGIAVSGLPRAFGDMHAEDFRAGLSLNIWLTLILALVGAVILHLTVFGRYVFAIGSSERTARLCGVRVDLWKTLCYVIAGVAAGLAGVMMASKFTAGYPAEFAGSELQIIAAVVIGGTSLFGGEGTIAGTFLGVVMLSLLSTGCNVAGINPFVQNMFIGGTILLAAALDRFRHLRK
jgi:ribose/xylose/arabinose/galactoside ABC-type transport system permease subunit